MRGESQTDPVAKRQRIVAISLRRDEPVAAFGLEPDFTSSAEFEFSRDSHCPHMTTVL